MPKGDTVFSKWFDRFNRGMVSKIGNLRIFLFRGTFDRLRRVAPLTQKESEANEEDILEMLRSLLVNVYTPSKHESKVIEEWKVTRGSLSKEASDIAKNTGDPDVETGEEICAAYVRPSGFDHKDGGFVMLFPASSKFLGEISRDSHPVVIEYVDKAPAWAKREDSEKEKIPEGFGDLRKLDATSCLEEGENFFKEFHGDFRECKIFPTDVLLESVHRRNKKGWWGLEDSDRKRYVKEDIVETPDLTPRAGKILVTDKPGLGFTLNEDAVCRAEEAYNKKKGL